MRPLLLVSFALIASISYLGLFRAANSTPASWERATPTNTLTPTTAHANRLLQRQPGFFVPNLGQWEHSARFVHRSGPMTIFLQNRGWVLDLVERPASQTTEPHAVHHTMPDDRDVEQKTRGVALRMTFEGDAHAPEIVGENKLPGHHNYFLGNDESLWRTGVPLHGSVRYENLYPGIDLRLREMNGVPEYDLLLQPGADLALVSVHVEGAQGLSIANDGSLVIKTALGPLTQSAPKTWEVGGDGRQREVVCNFTLLGADRFGFAATGWDGDTCLTIDPGLIWSTYLGGSGAADLAYAVAVDESGVITLAGETQATNFPTTAGAYDTTHHGISDAYVTRLDPRQTGSAQLVYSTYLGGSDYEGANAVSADASGVATVAGYTRSTNFPTTSGAFGTTHSGAGADAFVCRLDPNKSGANQLVYSTFLGTGVAQALSVDASGVVTVVGGTGSPNFPTTSGAFDTTLNGGSPPNRVDAFVSRLDPSKSGSAQLVYSTFLGGRDDDSAWALSVDASGVVTVAGYAGFANFPTTSGAYDRTFNGPSSTLDAFVSRLDPGKTGSAQLVYSTFLGGIGLDIARALSVDASGVVTVTGLTGSSNFPMKNAYPWTFNRVFDAFVSRLDPSKSGGAQLVYSTFLGGSGSEDASALSVDASGVVTVAGRTGSSNFPTTSGAYDGTFNGGFDDAFVSRLDPNKSGSAQLVYSTFLGGRGEDDARALSVDASGVVTVVGSTNSANFPTTTGAYDTAYKGYDAIVTRLDMGVALYGDVHEIPITKGGTQKLTVNAGKAHANRLYWIFGSMTGTTGFNLLGVHIPLTPDPYTDLAMTAVNGKEFTNFKGRLDANGLAAASFNLPPNLKGIPPGFTLYHAYVVYDTTVRFFMASNAVPVRLR